MHCTYCGSPLPSADARCPACGWTHADAPTLATGTPPPLTGVGIPDELRDDLEATFAPRFEFRAVLGRGGMGMVLEARDLLLDRRVAVKLVLPQGLEQDPTARQRLLREARAAATVAHPNVVAIYAVGETTRLGVPYIVMELVDGETLAAILRRDEKVDVVAVAHLLGRVADALAGAHRKGVIHRDLKPSNIMLERHTDRVVVLDFGISQVAQVPARSEAKLTGTGTYIGTPMYMSPEQALGEPASDRSDIYSLGCTAYELLAGHPPFEEETALALVAAHIKETPTDIATAAPRVPGPLAEAVMAMLRKAPGQRPTAEFLRDRFLPIGDDSWWRHAEFTRVGRLVRSATKGGFWLVVAAALVMIYEGASGGSAIDSLSTSRVAEAWAAIAFVLLAAFYLIAVANAFAGSMRLRLSARWICALASDGPGELGVLLARRGRFATLSPQAVGRLVLARAVSGGLLLATPVIVGSLWVFDLSADDRFLYALAILLTLVVGRTILAVVERLMTGEFLLVDRRGGEERGRAAVASGLSGSTAFLPWPGRSWQKVLLGAIASVVWITTLAAGLLVLLAGVVFGGAAWRKNLHGGPGVFRNMWASTNGSATPDAYFFSPQLHPSPGGKEWETFARPRYRGVRVDTAPEWRRLFTESAPTLSVDEYRQVRRLFPPRGAIPPNYRKVEHEAVGDVHLLTRVIGAALRGLTSEQRRFLLEKTQGVDFADFTFAAESDHDPFWQMWAADSSFRAVHDPWNIYGGSVDPWVPDTPFVYNHVAGLLAASRSRLEDLATRRGFQAALLLDAGHSVDAIALLKQVLFVSLLERWGARSVRQDFHAEEGLKAGIAWDIILHPARYDVPYEERFPPASDRQTPGFAWASVIMADVDRCGDPAALVSRASTWRSPSDSLNHINWNGDDSSAAAERMRFLAWRSTGTTATNYLGVRLNVAFDRGSIPLPLRVLLDGLSRAKFYTLAQCTLFAAGY